MSDSVSLSFAFAARPGWQADALTKLSRTVTDLLTRGGAAPEQFELLPRERGWEASIGSEVSLPHLLAEVLRELPEVVRRFSGLGLVVTVEDAPEPEPPPAADHATVVVPAGLREALDHPGFRQLPGTDAWYCRIAAATGTPTPLAETLAAATAVVLGFDGTLTRLYAPGKARDAALRLLSVVVEARDPEDALSGRPVPRAGSSSEFVHPLDVLRAFTGQGALTDELHDQLDRIERQAVYSARPTPHAVDLVRVLRASERPLAIATDTAPRAVTTYVRTHGLGIPLEALHCRAPAAPRLMPEPECLSRALRQLGVAAGRCVMIGATVPEATAARALGLPFVGLATDGRSRERLLAAGARHVVASLDTVAHAVRGT
ncbi:HAD family hydrolase [Streptomyces sp. PmtG]